MLKVYFPLKFLQISVANDNQYLPRSRSWSKWNLFKLSSHPAKDCAISSQVISFIPLLSEILETEILKEKCNLKISVEIGILTFEGRKNNLGCFKSFPVLTFILCHSELRKIVLISPSSYLERSAVV